MRPRRDLMDQGVNMQTNSLLASGAARTRRFPQTLAEGRAGDGGSGGGDDEGSGGGRGGCSSRSVSDGSGVGDDSSPSVGDERCVSSFRPRPFLLHP
jgi:hypothetical protein